MAPRKPTWDWKARNCAEFKHFTVAFAVKEYVQNVVGQALKDLQTREWSEWEREDMRDVPVKQRELRKQSLVDAYPGLLTGPHGAALKRTKAWLPWYILSARIPRTRLMPTVMTTDLRIALVVWRHTGTDVNAFSVYNNHLDSRATFSSFTVDGSSTSRDNLWAVGEKGKGFILATQFLFEYVEKHAYDLKIKASDPSLFKNLKAGVWKKSHNKDEDKLLQVVLDDLTPRTVQEYIDKRAAEIRFKTRDPSDEEDNDDDSSSSDDMPPTPENPQLRKEAEAVLKKVYTQRVTQQLDCKADHDVPRHSLVSSDEVSITIIGLDGSLEPEYLFSAIYGIIPPPLAWRVPNTPVQFFVAVDGASSADRDVPQARFYHRDQYVPYGLHLHKLSINYHGDLSITSDRVAILRNWKTTQYQFDVSHSADQAFRTIPELAELLALDILSDEHSEGLAHHVRPTNKDGADTYRAAFEAAMRKTHPEISEDARIYPAPDGDTILFGELGLIPVKVSPNAWKIMETSGAYVEITDYAREVLLSSPPVAEFKGLSRLRVALSVVAPDVPSENVTIRQYDKSSPTVAWDKENSIFAFSLPRQCEEHPEGKCLCWVGPFLHKAARAYEGGQLETKTLFRAYLLCMEGTKSMKEDVSEADNAGMDIDSLFEDNEDRGEKTPSFSDPTSSGTNSESDLSDGDYIDDDSDNEPISPAHDEVLASDDRDSEQTVRSRPTRSTCAAARRKKRQTQTWSPSPAPVDFDRPAVARKASKPILPTCDADATLNAVSSLVAQYKEKKSALDDATAIVDTLKDEINAAKIVRNTLETQVDVLKIDCAAHERRIAELARMGGEKDVKLSELEKEVKRLSEQIEEVYAGIEALNRLKLPKRPRPE
ncbi:hypothetical protein B0H10DRAFT_2057105 [Mycena sp. CBHHK59/15]|nr:hypothetical protein B0H10DRAFT_2057105 [Mycena sp. CBHHK59/15]